jgi:L-fuconolactonase
MLIIDAHVHTGDTWEEPIEILMAQMELNGVSHALLAQFNGQYDNTYLLDCARRYGNKFKAVVNVDPQDKARTKALEALHKQGAAGIRLNSREEWDPDDPVFKLAGELGMPVSVIGTTKQFTSAAFKKLLDNCPKTQFCLEHLARSAKPGVDFAKPPHDGYMAALECARWPNTTVKVPGLGEIVERPSRFPAGHPFSTSTIPPLFEMAKEAFGVQRMMWASNFPPCASLEGYRHALQWVRDYPAFQTGDDVEWIMGKSAAKLWGFPS